MNPTTETTSTSSPARARALGWFSLGLGAAELFTPRVAARFIGVEDTMSNRNVLRAFGARELAAGVGLLLQPGSPRFAWMRVAGDVLDLAALTRALVGGRGHTLRLLGSLGAVVGATAADIAVATALTRQHGKADDVGQREVSRAITIDRPAHEIYTLWRDFENLPRFMSHLEEVVSLGEKTSHWVVKTVGGLTVEWDAELTDDEPDRRIAWRSMAHAKIDQSGSVEFRSAPRGRGTEVVVTLRYTPPAGKLGVAIASLVGEEPGQIVDHALRQLKQLLELGEIVRSDASIHKGMHPARPSATKVEPAKSPRVRVRVVPAASASASPIDDETETSRDNRPVSPAEVPR